MPLFPRVHLFEINDEPWLPSAVRERVQECLTIFWTTKLPFFQSASPAALVTETLKAILGARTSDFTYVDFCAGAGGPTPFIEQQFNRRSSKPADFVLTDIEPHVSAWQAASARSSNLLYVPAPVDAANPPPNLAGKAHLSSLARSVERQPTQKKVFRLFFLAFHHMPDNVAREILRTALQDPDCGGVGIFELQGRTLGELLMVCIAGPMLWMLAPVFFWRDPLMLVFTYLIPIVPFVIVFDGIVSCLRTRTGEEVLQLMAQSGASQDGWRSRYDEVVHSWPIGYLRWFMLVRED